MARIQSSQSIWSEKVYFKLTKSTEEGLQIHGTLEKVSSLVIPGVSVSSCVVQKQRSNVSKVFARSWMVKGLW